MKTDSIFSKDDVVVFVDENWEAIVVTDNARFKSTRFFFVLKQRDEPDSVSEMLVLPLTDSEVDMLEGTDRV